MKVMRTPDAAFINITDFPFAPNYREIADPLDGTELRIHYIDEGPRAAPVVLMMHGEPSWCYLYRHMIGPVVDAGFRVVAPDLVGFGKSDKPARRSDYTYARHVGWMRQWIEAINLTGITLVCQDWGSLVGLRMLTEMSDRFAAVVLSNGGLPEGGSPPKFFAPWRAFANWSPFFPIGGIVNSGTKRALSAAEIAAYDAPFPNSTYKAGARAFPSLVPFEQNSAIPDQKCAWQVLERWEKPFLCCFGDAELTFHDGEHCFIGRVPGTAGQPHRTLKGGHFIQEDDPQGFVRAILQVAKK